MKLKKSVFSWVVLFGFLAALIGPVEAKKAKKTKPFVPVSSYVVMEAETGKILSSENAQVITFPASVTKIMSFYLIFEDLEKKKIKFSTKMPVSYLATRQAPCKLGLKKGQQIRVMDALLGMVTKSCNESSVVFAEYLEGSVENFVARMNRKAKELGMHQTVFENPHGLPPIGKPNMAQHTTAKDLAVLSRAIYKRFPNYYRYFRTKSFVFQGQVHHNHNKLLGKAPGVDGIKTGFINASGFNISVSAKRDGVRLITIVLGGSSGRERDKKVLALMDRVFATDLRAYRNLNPRDPDPLPLLDATPNVTQVAKALDLKPEEASLDGLFAEYAPQTQSPDVEGDESILEVNADPVDSGPVESVALNTIPLESKSEPGDELLEDSNVRDALINEFDEDTSLTNTFAAAIAEQAQGEPDVTTPKLQTVASTVHVDSNDSKDWIVQLGAYGRAQGAKDRLHAVVKKLDTLPGKSSIEKKGRKSKPYYQAQVSGLNQNQAQNICRDLKEGGDLCLALKSGKPIITPLVVSAKSVKKKPTPSILPLVKNIPIKKVGKKKTKAKIIAAKVKAPLKKAKAKQKV